MGILSWIIFGGLAGWVASMIMGRDRNGCLTNIFVGIVGAFIGGFIMNLLGGHPVHGFTLRGFGVAVLGAVILLGITGWGSKRWR